MPNPKPFFTDDLAGVSYNPDSAIASITVLVFDRARVVGSQA